MVGYDRDGVTAHIRWDSSYDDAELEMAFDADIRGEGHDPAAHNAELLVVVDSGTALNEYAAVRMARRVARRLDKLQDRKRKAQRRSVVSVNSRGDELVVEQ